MKSLHFKLHIFSLCALAIAQPLLEVISRNAELLVARQAGVVDLAILVFALSILVPLLLVLPGQIARVYGTLLSDRFFLGTIVFLVSLLALLSLKEITDGSSAYLVLMALLLGVLFASMYTRFEALPMICDFLAPAILLVPILFVFNSNISRVVANSDGTQFSFSGARNNIPVVMVVFDELPLLSLLDETANIDSVRYPNFATLASESHWFRNARSLSGSTTIAIPAIVSGETKPDALPIAVDYPRNLFTLLNASHQLNVTEQVTSLCPQSVCDSTAIGTPQALQQRLEGFFYRSGRGLSSCSIT